MNIHSIFRGQRVAILADVQNLYYATVRNGKRLNYQKLMDVLTGDRTLAKAVAFVVHKENAQSQEKFFDALRYMGWDLNIKTLQEDGKKSDQDMELAMEALTISDNVDTIVLVSGDSDFINLVSRLRYKGKRVEVASFNAYTSNKLMKAADRFYSLDDIDELVTVAEDEIVSSMVGGTK